MAGIFAKRQIKRSDCLVFFFEGEGLHCVNYLTGSVFASAPILVSTLAVLDRWRSASEIERLLREYSGRSVRRTIRNLLARKLVVEQGTPQAKREKELAPWGAWGLEARFFHFLTKAAFRAGGPLPDEKTYARALLRKSPQPDFFKRYPGARQLLLPQSKSPRNSEFARVLRERRTHRSFAPGALSLDELALLLRLTWGVTEWIHWPGLGKLPVKTSPSGGCRQPLEVYVWAHRVAGVPRGIYHYRADRHVLERLKGNITAAQAARLCARQGWVNGCSALFIMTAVFPRVMWRYPSSRAYRVVLLEAGHFCQTFLLAATWLGLAPFCTAALRDEEIEKALGLDGARESVLYAAGVGLRSRTLPAGKEC